MLLPSEGVCHGCYILAYCAGLDEQPTVSELLERARRLPSGDSFFRDLKELAIALLNAGIVLEEGGRVRFVPEFPDCHHGADRNTKFQIARVLLAYARPDWLPSSGDADLILRGLMPSTAQTALSWMGPDLAHVFQSLLTSEDRGFSSQALGRIGEEAILAAEHAAGYRVRHVSLISDSYGYDIESCSGGQMRRIEAKCTIEGRAGRFFLSRNEYEQSRRQGPEWILVQVILRSDIAFRAPTLDANSIRTINWVPGSVISDHVVADRANCRWHESVEFNIPQEIWSVYPHRPEVSWRIGNLLLRR